MIKFNFETTDKLIELYNQGLTQTAISKMYGVTPAAISYRLAKAGIPIRKNKFSQLAHQRAYENRVRGRDHHSFHDIPLDTLAKEYESGIAAEILSIKYNISRNGILRKLQAAGVTPRKGGFPSKWYAAKDGHKVQSQLEIVVDDWLYEHGVDHIPQPRLPFGKMNTRADFLIGDLYIEVLGLISNPKYKIKYERKLELYKSHSLKVLYIYPAHFRDNLSILNQLL